MRFSMVSQSYIFTVTIQQTKNYGKTDKLIRSTREYQNENKFKKKTNKTNTIQIIGKIL